MGNFKKKLKDKWRKTLFINDRKRLENTDFTIISNNCWGGNVSRDLDVKHHSPFVGLFIYSPDYLKICKDLDYYMKQELQFIETSKYDSVNKQRESMSYPLALLGDVELNFQHYDSEKEADLKWNRRKERINWENIFFKFEESFGATPDLLSEFDRLPHKNKIIFTEEKYPNLTNAVHFTTYDLANRNKHYHRYFDIVEWLNTGKIVRY